jgi:peptidoglycan hydrolase-like protein with peptidoglycan-binding domain
MEMNKRVIDVSAYTPLTRVPWSDSRIDAGYVKLTEGVSLFDRLAGAHLYNLAHVKKPAGVYHFFHPSHSAQAQFDWFVHCAEQTCWGKVGDLVPAIDLERNVTDGAPTHSWNESAEVLCNLLSVRFGGCLIYCGQSTFAEMGKPPWLVDCSQWVPEWSKDGYPVIAPYFVKGLGSATPVMVQNYVGPLFGSIQESTAPNAVDQNYAGELIAITGGIAISEHPPLMIGSSGPEVALWQQIVHAKVDGVFGPRTSAATSEWQTASGLECTGSVGDADWRQAFASNGWIESEGVKGAARVVYPFV